MRTISEVIEEFTNNGEMTEAILSDWITEILKEAAEICDDHYRSLQIEGIIDKI